MELTTKQKQEIKAFAVKKYETLHDTHGRQHAYRTANLAESIARREDANHKICRYGALLHQYHPEGAHQVREYLLSIGVTSSFVEQIVHCVECSEPETINRANTIEARVVFDADKLQTLGPFGLVREISYRTATRNLGFKECVDEARKLQDTMNRLIQTHTGKQIATDLMKQSTVILSSYDKWQRIAGEYPECVSLDILH
ncbi:MAG: hypothetical protein KGY80_06125 [Candidatus Thorarchaeota archaeon]|nr:hypothetical protein [Candidatus Thorarchaeota archaeon]